MISIDRIKTLATKQGDSLASLERKLGFANGSISRWRHNTPSADKLQKVADYFNVSTDYLLNRTEYPNSYVESSSKPKVKILSRKMEDLDNSQLDVLDGLIDQFFDKKFSENGDKN